MTSLYNQCTFCSIFSIFFIFPDVENGLKSRKEKDKDRNDEVIDYFPRVFPL